MVRKIVPMAAVPVAALVLAACVPQSAYNEQAKQLEEAQAQVAAGQAEIAKMQAENRWVMAGDLLFPEGGYQLSAAGQAALSQFAPQLSSVQNAKVVVYGFTDNVPVGPVLQRAGIADNLDLSCCRCRVSPVAGGQPEHPVGQGVRRNASRRAERHAPRPGAEPPDRDRTGGTRRLILDRDNPSLHLNPPQAKRSKAKTG